jgi:catecholate siderophore receptor
MSIKHPATLCSATALAVCSWSVQAHDAEPSATVIVEGAREPYRNDAASLDKFTEAERDTPQSIATMTRDAMDDRAADSINEALSRAPGITLGAGEYSWQGNNFSVRGFSARNDMFLGGMRDFGNYYRDEFYLQDIEVIKGPSSTLFGRGSTGGAINQVPKLPRADAMFRGKVILDSADMRRLTADLSQPIAEHAAFRINAMNHESTVADRDGGESRRYGVTPALTLGLGTRTRFTAHYLHQRADDVPDYGLPWFNGAPARVPRHNFYGFDSDSMKTGADVGTLWVEHALPNQSTWYTSMRYGRYDRRFRITEPQVPATVPADTPLESIAVARNIFAGDGEETVLLAQTHVTSRFTTGALTHALLVGIEAARETSRPRYITTVGTPGTGLLHPDAAGGFTSAYDYTRFNADTQARSVAFYALDTLKLSEHWQIVGGVRWDRFDARYRSIDFASGGSVVNSLAVARVDEEMSYRAALVYKPLAAMTLYLSHGTSFNPSAEGLSLVTSGRTFNQGNAFLAPERNRLLELGGKIDVLDDKLALRTAVFDIEKSNARVPDPEHTGFNMLAGKHRVQGVELEATGMVTARWHLIASYTWLDAKVDKSMPGAAPAGTALTLTAEHAASWWSAFKLDSVGNVVIGAGASYVGERFGQNYPRALVAPGYWTADLMLRWRVMEHLGIQLNAYNITDRYYFEQLHPFHVIPGAGRTIKVTIGVGW